jgi:phosphonate transport system permease protein
MKSPAAGGRYDSLLARDRRAWGRSALRAALVLALVLACCAQVGLFDANRLAEGWPSVVGLVREMLPPDFRAARTWLGPLLDTLAMSVAATALAVVLSAPLALLAARNTTPHPLAYRAARSLLNLLRTIPELILGILFVAAVGFGALPGVLALGLHSVGMVGKFFAESIEHVDDAPVEAVRASGASPLQVIVHAVLPQVLPQMADVTVYRWEYNFRASTVMGAVGAGGIGLQLIAALRLMQYRQVSALLLVILLMVTVVDGLGGRLRRRFQ